MTEYEIEIVKIQERFSVAADGSSIGVVVPAAMNLILNAILTIPDKEAALAVTQSLRPMIDYIESRLSTIN